MPALAQAKPKVVVIGGGPGGATVAKYVAKDSERRDRGHAGRAAAAVHHLLPLQSLSRRLPHLGIDHPFLRRAGVEIRRQARPPGGAGDRPRQEDRPARRRHAAAVRPAGGRARHRHQVRFGAGLFGGGYARAMPHAWKPGPQTQLLKRQLDALRGRRDHRDDRAAQSLSLPARTLRARLDDGACAQGQGSQEIDASSSSIPRRPSPSRRLFQEGWEKHYPGMVEWQDPKMHGGIKSVDAEDHDGEDRSRRATRRRSSTSSRRRWPARSRATPASPIRAASARSIRPA